MREEGLAIVEHAADETAGREHQGAVDGLVVESHLAHLVEDFLAVGVGDRETNIFENEPNEVGGDGFFA